jgi:prophage tail gpP-like protein
VAVGGQALIEGFVDAVEPSCDATSHGVRVSGRDSAGDLVDCSAEPGEWHGQPLSQLVSAIGAPFGLRVSAETSLDAPFERFRIQEGETAWAAIERACQMRGVLCLSDGLGW